MNAPATNHSIEDEWLWGWDPTPGIVSVWADWDGHATVWRRVPETGALLREETRFRPWLLLDCIDDLRVLGSRAARADDPMSDVTDVFAAPTRSNQSIVYRELSGDG